MAPHFRQKQLYFIMKGYYVKPEEGAAYVTATVKEAFKHWMNHTGVARLSIRLGIDPSSQPEYMVVNDLKMASKRPG